MKRVLRRLHFAFLSEPNAQCNLKLNLKSLPSPPRSYYTGKAHPGEFVTLHREPNNPYDRFAIRVDNMHGQKVGHVKGTSAKPIAQVMDNPSMNLRIEAIIPRNGNAYELPLFLEYYSVAVAASVRDTAQLGRALAAALKRDYAFSLTPEFGGTASGKSSSSTSTSTSSTQAPVVVRKKLDWNKQQQALDEMFDKQLEIQYENLPNVKMPSVFRDIELFDFQKKGIKWLVKQELESSIPPFYTEVREGGQKVRLISNECICVQEYVYIVCVVLSLDPFSCCVLLRILADVPL